MEADRPRTPHALLTRHFLRQFLENDLISPDADRSQLLAVVGSMLLSLTLFVSVFRSGHYLIVILMPGQAAVTSLDDKFFFIALAMIVTALAAATQWDALAIDSRDAAILEPLPVRASTIRRAKASAIAILGAGVAVGINASASVIFPWMLSFRFRQMRLVELLWLVATHAIVTVAAACFGYVAIVALREVLAAIMAPRWFTRVSPWAQGALIVILGSCLLLLVPTADRIGQRGFEGWRAMTPPTWFLGAYEMAAGGVLADLPRSAMTPRQARNDQIATTLYQERRRQFAAMARRAGLAIGVLFFVAAISYLWNARRLPSLAPTQPPAFRRHWRLGERLANGLLVRDPAARAGFHFTLAAMWRSNTHRLTLSCAAAVGFAMAVLALSNANALQGAGPSTRLLAMQPLLYGALLVGFRHVIRVPAELRANWGFQLAWRGRERAFVGGAKIAAIVALVLPALAVLLPLFVFVLGPQRALMHAGLGLAGAIVLLEALMLNYYDKVPFTCTYVPTENMKALAPLYAIAFFIGAAQFARMQNNALLSGNPIRVLITLAILFAILRVWSMKRARRRDIEFHEAPASYQTLGLGT